MSDEELFSFYSENYFRGEEYRDYASEKAIIQKNFKLRYEVLRSFIDPERHKQLFEIGCAYGFFLDLVRDDFEKVGGIDVTEAGIRFAQEELKLPVTQGDFLDYDLGGEKLDVVCMWDAIEHIRHPHLYLEKVGRNMDSGGLVAITTGDIESVPARLRGAKWRLIHPPTHAHYFSRDTLAKMLSNYGFEIVYHRYCGFYRSTESIAYGILVLRKQRPKLFERLSSAGLLKFDIYLNFYDIMYTIARKR
jgi:2-polyprenyl-3-methyl-5-hydroxy-6-metoxy-1,4-benzoquinol methylase